jgi:1-acyl-sn-glycerol-3-phosphate acyltransferase
MAYTIIKRTIFPLIRLYIKKINGVENLPERSGFIFAANHASYMDHFILGAIMVSKYNQKLHFLAKKEHFGDSFQRAWHRHVGAIPLDREMGGKGALATAIRYLRKGKIIGIYPEGTRTLTGALQRAKTGVARLALAARVPVVPVGLIGTFQMLPKGKIIPRFRRASANIGEPMFFDKYYGKENNKKALRLVTTEIMKEISRLSKQRYDL